MKHLKKAMALLLSALLLISVCAVPAAAADAADGGYELSEKAEHLFYRFADKLILMIGRVLNALIPGLDWKGKIPKAADASTDFFYPGEAKFANTPAVGARWRMGFAKASFLDNIDVTDGSYLLAGDLAAMEGISPTGVMDDQGVAAYALSDGTTTVVYAAIDGYGITRGDVLRIRSRLADVTERYHVTSVNVSVLHQHSCIDTLGFSVPLVPAVLTNPAASLFNEDKMLTGVNEAFMEEVYAAVTASVTEALQTMSDGTLYYGSADIGDYIHDKRDPEVYDKDLQRLRFVPDDPEKNEIWVLETGIHCVAVSASGRLVSSDFPYYLKQYIKDNVGADAVFIEGAELALTRDTSTLTYDLAENPNAVVKALGEAIAERAIATDNDIALAPVLNVAHRELKVKVDNPIHTLAGREGLLSSVMVRDGLGYAVITEIGYMELGGGEVGILIVPGEIEPAILWGGAPTAEQSWTGDSWDHAPLESSCGAKKLICFGLCNDQIGYILCDNDYRSMLTENEEINAVSPHSGSEVTEAYEALFREIR